MKNYDAISPWSPASKRGYATPITVAMGIPPRPPFAREMKRHGRPSMVSANSMWDNDTKTWHVPPYLKDRKDVWLDSGGFVAMNIYGGFRYSMTEYLDLVEEMKPAVYFTMDYCCEPEITADSYDETENRIHRTVDTWTTLTTMAAERGLPRPAPVVTGSTGLDFIYCLGLYTHAIHLGAKWKAYCRPGEFDGAPGGLPALIGVGTLCRRKVHGTDGILDVIGWLDRHLEKDYKKIRGCPTPRLHLFGVKGAALNHLRDHPRVHSIDSMAWCYRARVTACRGKFSNTNAHKLRHLNAWLDRHLGILAGKNPELPGLLFPAQT